MLLCLLVNFLAGLMGASRAARALELGTVAKYAALVLSAFPLLNIAGAGIVLLQVQTALASAEDVPVLRRPSSVGHSYGDLTPVHTPPSLTTINGIGFKLYGKSEIDPRTNSFMTTQYFVAIFVPLFPVARYRVVSKDGYSYEFLGKGKLRVIDKVHLAAFIAVVLYAIKNAGLK